MRKHRFHKKYPMPRPKSPEELAQQEMQMAKWGADIKERLDRLKEQIERDKATIH